MEYFSIKDINAASKDPEEFIRWSQERYDAKIETAAKKFWKQLKTANRWCCSPVPRAAEKLLPLNALKSGSPETATPATPSLWTTIITAGQMASCPWTRKAMWTTSPPI